MSLNGLIETSRRTFRALDGAMNTAGQNVANAETEGYARRRITLKADTSATAGVHVRSGARGLAGAGVSIGTFERVRDDLMLRAGWSSRAGLGAAEEEHRVLSAMESVFPTGEGSLSATLGRFWEGWSDVADHPTDAGARIALRADASALTDTFNRIDTDLTDLEAETREALSARVDEANTILAGLADLNVTIRSARYAGTPDFAAEDQRDRQVTELSRLLPVHVETGEDYVVSVGGVSVADGNGADRLVFDGAGVPPTLTFEDARLPLRAPAQQDGAVGALFRTLTDTIPNTRAGLDALAGGLVEAVNTLHTPRFDDTGAALPDGDPFFDAAGTTAGTIALDAAVAADAGAVAPRDVFTADGDELAVAVAALRDADLPGVGARSESAAVNLLVEVGTAVRSASTRSAGQGAVVAHLDAHERGVSGVSMDDELAGLIRYQQAFGAAARVLSTAQQMMDTLLAI